MGARSRNHRPRSERKPRAPQLPRLRRAADVFLTPTTTEEGLHMLDVAMSEAEWQAEVVEEMERDGWKVWHDNDSRRNDAGWPDLVALRGSRMIVVELKKEGGATTPEQREWLAAFQSVADLAPRVEVHVWRPRDRQAMLAALA